MINVPGVERSASTSTTPHQPSALEVSANRHTLHVAAFALDGWIPVVDGRRPDNCPDRRILVDPLSSSAATALVMPCPPPSPPIVFCHSSHRIFRSLLVEVIDALLNFPNPAVLPLLDDRQLLRSSFGHDHHSCWVLQEGARRPENVYLDRIGHHADCCAGFQSRTSEAVDDPSVPCNVPSHVVAFHEEEEAEDDIADDADDVDVRDVRKVQGMVQDAVLDMDRENTHR